ncbi:MAG: methyltransferase domain-containing protein [Acidimicrobiales bacterium]
MCPATVSNGAINLSPRKRRAFAKIARVLRPGGRFCVSDLVVDDDLPPEVLSSGPARAGCNAWPRLEHHMTDERATWEPGVAEGGARGSVCTGPDRGGSGG